MSANGTVQDLREASTKLACVVTEMMSELVESEGFCAYNILDLT